MLKTPVRSSIKFDPPDAFQAGVAADARADSRSGDVYVFNDKIRLAVQVALATARPLLVRGDSGWGKSSLASASARYLGWPFHEAVITSRTQARDLQWTVDLLLRLSDAQSQNLDRDWHRYVTPGVLWRALDPPGAAAQQRRHDGTGETEKDAAAVPSRAVILLDEIDKADPDVPNNLLVALGSLEFQVEETGQKVSADKQHAPLVFITTNEERELPAAFLRRCVELKLPALPDEDRDGSQRRALLVNIVTEHTGLKTEYVQRIADLIAPPSGPEAAILPSPAEFKDTVLALFDRWGESEPPAEQVAEIARITFTKRGPAR